MGRKVHYSVRALDTVAPAVVSLRREIKLWCPWMTPELLSILYRQKSMYRRVVRSKRQDLKAVPEHRQLRNRYTNFYKQLKNNHFQQRLLSYRLSPKPFWLTINHITGRQRQTLPTPVSLYYHQTASTIIFLKAQLPKTPSLLFAQCLYRK